MDLKCLHPFASTSTLFCHPIVGTLKDGYIRNVPLPRVQRIQSASNYTKTTQSQVDAYEYASGKGNSLPDYLPVSSWIPRLPKLGRLIRFSQEIL